MMILYDINNLSYQDSTALDQRGGLCTDHPRFEGDACPIMGR